MKTKTPVYVWLSFFVMLAASIFSLSIRYRIEASNKAVGTLMEGNAVAELASASGMDFGSLLTLLKSSGLVGVALAEESVADLIDRNEITVESAPIGFNLRGKPETLARVARAIARRGGLASPAKLTPSGLNFQGDVRVLRATYIGINRTDAVEAQVRGLVIVARHNNVVGAGPAYIHDVLEESKSLGATAYLPAGEQVLGQRESIEDTYSSLEALELNYLTPEFVKIAGDAKLAASIPKLTIRLHSMQQAEVDKSSPGAVIDRYKLAFRERNIRWLLVRPVTLGGPSPVRSTCKFLADLQNKIQHAGGAVKKPRPYPEYQVPAYILAIIGLSSIPWLFYLLSLIFDKKHVVLSGLISVGIGMASLTDSTRSLAALGIGVLGATFALTTYLHSEKKARNVFVWLLVISGISLASGLAIAGLLNNLEYMIQIKQPLGIKAILLGPVVLAGYLLLKEVSNWNTVKEATMKWGPALTGLLILGAVAFLVIRSGNDSPAAVSESELKGRALLDQIFYTRPRTKEFLIGHPAMILGILLFRESLKKSHLKSWAVILITLGMIGQGDIVDTLCHTHTPLDIGLARVGLGLVVGGIIGGLLWLPMRAWIAKSEEQ